MPLQSAAGPHAHEREQLDYCTPSFFPARTNTLHTWRQNSAVISPAKNTVNILDERNNKNFNAVGKAPQCIMLSFSLNLVLHNQCTGPKLCKLFLNIQTANWELLLKRKKEKKMQTLKWMELPHPSSLTSKARLADWHRKQMCQSHLLLADSPAAAVPEFFLQYSAGLVMQQKQVTMLLGPALPGPCIFKSLRKRTLWGPSTCCGRSRPLGPSMAVVAHFSMSLTARGFCLASWAQKVLNRSTLGCDHTAAELLQRCCSFFNCVNGHGLLGHTIWGTCFVGGSRPALRNVLLQKEGVGHGSRVIRPCNLWAPGLYFVFLPFLTPRVPAWLPLFKIQWKRVGGRILHSLALISCCSWMGLVSLPVEYRKRFVPSHK